MLALLSVLTYNYAMIVTEQNTPLNLLHTFRLPGIARVVYLLRDKNQCVELPTDNYLVVGHGSNTIFTSNFERPLVRVELRGVHVEDTDTDWLITVAAGENWHQLVSNCVESGYLGLENLALIPGTVGAAPVQNIGAYGSEVAQFIESVEAWDRQQHCFVELSHDDCKFGYRDSLFKRDPERWLITEVRLRLAKRWQPNTGYAELADLVNPSALDIYRRVIAVRRKKLPDPEHLPNAGSFFKNPIISAEHFNTLSQRYPNIKGYPNADGSVKLAAGWLIEQCGWKGKQCGAIQVHQQQALVLVNTGSGSGTDLLALARAIKDDILQHFAVALEIEVRLFNQQELVQL